MVLIAAPRCTMAFMSSTHPILPPDIEAAVVANHGGPVSVAGQFGNYIVMNLDVYAEPLAVSPGDMAESVAAIQRSLGQAEAGQVRDLNDAFDDLERRYGS